jgi:hypothetical protein
VDVRRFLPLVAEEEESVASNTEDSRHRGNLPGAGGRRQRDPQGGLTPRAKLQGLPHNGERSELP